jgi:hypothetical protein
MLKLLTILGILITLITIILIIVYKINKLKYPKQDKLITLNNLYKIYDNVNYPIIIPNFLKKHILMKYNFSYFKENYKNIKINIIQNFTNYNNQKLKIKEIDLGSYIDKIEEGKTDKYYFKSEDNYQFLKEIGHEKEIIDLFSNITPKFSIIKNSFWMGPKGSCTPLHYDSDYFNLLCVVEGQKEIILIHPKYTKYIYEMDDFLHGSSWSKVDIWNIDYLKYPLFNNINYKRILLNAGDILNIPKYWWHGIKNTQNTIAFTYHYYTISSILTIDIPEILISLLDKIKSNVFKKKIY